MNKLKLHSSSRNVPCGIFKNKFSPPFFIMEKGRYQTQSHKFCVGFTLVEILIVVFIISLVAVAIIASIRRGNSTNNLRFASQNLTEILKQAQSMTLAGRMTGGGVPNGGYGVRVVVNSASLQNRFLLCANNQLNDYTTCGAGDTTLESASLPENGITIQAYIDGVLQALNSIDIAFTSPSAIIYVNGNPQVVLRFILTNSAGNTREVYLDAHTGLIQ